MKVLLIAMEKCEGGGSCDVKTQEYCSVLQAYEAKMPVAYPEEDNV